MLCADREGNTILNLHFYVVDILPLVTTSTYCICPLYFYFLSFIFYLQNQYIYLISIINSFRIAPFTISILISVYQKDLLYIHTSSLSFYSTITYP